MPLLRACSFYLQAPAISFISSHFLLSASCALFRVIWIGTITTFTSWKYATTIHQIEDIPPGYFFSLLRPTHSVFIPCIFPYRHLYPSLHDPSLLLSHCCEQKYPPILLLTLRTPKAWACGLRGQEPRRSRGLGPRQGRRAAACACGKEACGGLGPRLLALRRSAGSRAAAAGSLGGGRGGLREGYKCSYRKVQGMNTLWVGLRRGNRYSGGISPIW